MQHNTLQLNFLRHDAKLFVSVILIIYKLNIHCNLLFDQTLHLPSSNGSGVTFDENCWFIIPKTALGP